MLSIKHNIFPKLIILFTFTTMLMVSCQSGSDRSSKADESSEDSTTTSADMDKIKWNQNELGDVSDDMMGEYIEYGYELITETQKYIGPNVPDPSMQFAGNNLTCETCHLSAGTKKFGAPYIGLDARFPQYRGRENTIGTLEERINGCMERSMNGERMPVDSKEMKAMVAYMHWLSKNVPVGETPEGRGFVEVEIPERKADLEHGEQVYDTHCTSCHQADGAGLRVGEEGDAKGYVYPPLWGDDSFNNGAGMHRVITASRFIKGNMPLGASYDNPMLSDEEVYDVAAYINSKDRPVKPNLEEDFPDLIKKPVDSPYPPFPDDFSREQHRFGPFQPIMKSRKKSENS